MGRDCVIWQLVGRYSVICLLYYITEAAKTELRSVSAIQMLFADLLGRISYICAMPDQTPCHASVLLDFA